MNGRPWRRTAAHPSSSPPQGFTSPPARPTTCPPPSLPPSINFLTSCTHLSSSPHSLLRLVFSHLATAHGNGARERVSLSNRSSSSRADSDSSFKHQLMVELGNIRLPRLTVREIPCMSGSSGLIPSRVRGDVPFNVVLFQRSNLIGRLG